jgi:hypothetical protein
MLGATAAFVASSARARADGPPPDELKVTAPEPEIAPRSWVYMDDPTTPAAWRATTFARVTATGSGGSTSRPFGADIAHPGSMFEVGGELGVTPWLSLAATGYTSTFGPADNGAFGSMVGLRAAPFASAWRTTHLVMSGGFLHGLSGGNGAWGRVSIAQDIGRVRLGSTVHGEKIFAAGHDSVDVMVMAGASYAVAGPLRAGVEYVAQDIEGAVDRAEADGGMRHFVGPTAGVELMGKRLTINGGPAVGLSKGSPPFLGRVAVAYAF